MPDRPLIPFTSPLTTLSHVGVMLPTGDLLTYALIGIFLLWALFTLVIIYHWLRYSHASLMTFPALFIHLVVSAGLMEYALTGRFLFI